MLSVALVTMNLHESGSAAGLLAHTLAHLLAGHGCVCDVIGAHGALPRPSHQEHGRIRYHRLSVRRGHREAGFGAAVAGRVLELTRSGRARRVVCIDAPRCADLLMMLHAQSLLDSVVRTLGVKREPGLSPVRLPALPVDATAWTPPAFGFPVLLTPGVEDERTRERVTRAYRASGAKERGWSLAMLGDDGLWMLQDRAEAPDNTRDAVLLDPLPGMPVLPMNAARFGIASITHAQSDGHAAPALAHHDGTEASLAEAINHATKTARDQREKSARRALADRADGDAVANALLDELQSPTPRDAHGARARWLGIESQLAAGAEACP